MPIVEPIREIRFSVMLTDDNINRLEKCSQYYAVSKGEVLRRGLVLVSEAVAKEERYRNSEHGKAIQEAEQERNSIIAGELFNAAYTAAYAKLITNPAVSANEARQLATDEANRAVTEKLPEALEQFWKN